VLLTSGKVCLRSSVATNVIVDTFGWSSNSGGLRALTPARILDTRQTAAWPYGVAVSPGAPLALRIADKGGVPNDASAALLTVTVDNAPSSGFVTAWPCDQPQPNASTLNLFQGVLRSNLALVKLSAVAGTVCLAVSTINGAPVHLIVDAVGSLTGGPARSAPPPDPAPPTTGSGTLPPGSALPSDAQCKAAVHAAPEVRPQNVVTNAKAGSSVSATYPRATGSFTGTTDEIIQWVACKWGIDADVVRAQAAKESFWTQSNLGDWTSDASVCAPGHGIGIDGVGGQCPESVGLMQVRTRFFRD
jgi:autotransporter family porin